MVMFCCISFAFNIEDRKPDMSLCSVGYLGMVGGRWVLGLSKSKSRRKSRRRSAKRWLSDIVCRVTSSKKSIGEAAIDRDDVAGGF